MSVADKALGGLKVLEWANFVSGPYCTKVMADLGAEVIRLRSLVSVMKQGSMGLF